MDSLVQTDALGGRGATHPRVSLDEIKNNIADYSFINAGAAIAAMGKAAPEPTTLLTLCIMTMKNGFVVIGKSAPASPENFDQEKGETFSFEDAIRQLWPLMGFSLRDRLHSDAEDTRLLALPYEQAAQLRQASVDLGNTAMLDRLDRLQIAVA